MGSQPTAQLLAWSIVHGYQSCTMAQVGSLSAPSVELEFFSLNASCKDRQPNSSERVPLGGWSRAQDWIVRLEPPPAGQPYDFDTWCLESFKVCEMMTRSGPISGWWRWWLWWWWLMLIVATLDGGVTCHWGFNSGATDAWPPSRFTQPNNNKHTNSISTNLKLRWGEEKHASLRVVLDQGKRSTYFRVSNLFYPVGVSVFSALILSNF